MISDTHMHDTLRPVQDGEFNLIRSLLYRKSGIALKDHKKTLVANRLRRRLEGLGLDTFRGYYEYLTEHPEGLREISEFLDCLTTNETFFYRYPEQLDYLARVILPGLLNRGDGDRTVRVWSAGCSSGEEPYSIAIRTAEQFDRAVLDRLEIVGSDISQAMIERARQAAFRPYAVHRLPEPLRRKYFVPDPACDRFILSDAIRNRVRFHRANLLETFTHGKFDVILCCNVFIYFDRESREKAVRRMILNLKPGGYFLVGFSESLLDRDFPFAYVRPAVYRKLESQGN